MKTISEIIKKHLKGIMKEQESHISEDGTYMVLSNLVQMKNDIEKILNYKHMPDFPKLVTGEHAWAGDHLTTSKDDIEEVANFMEGYFEQKNISEDVKKKVIYEDDYGFVEETDYISNDLLNEAEYQGRKVQLGKIMQGDIKKFKVYVKNDKGKVVKVNFGFGGKSAKGKRMVIKKNNPERRKSFRARHNCENPGPRWKPRYWACRTW
jgi:hypothetical protein